MRQSAQQDRPRDAAWNQRLARARVDRATFIETAAADDHGRPLKLAAIHKQWINHVAWCWGRGLRALILAPWGHGKTSTLAVPLLAFELGRNPGLRAKVLCNSDANACRRVDATRNILESPIYRAVFPHVQKGPRWTSHELTVARRGNAVDPSLEGRGWDTVGVGGRADLIVLDDVADQRNVADPGQRQKVAEFVDGTWLSRLEPDGRVLAIGTAWHVDDLWHRFLRRPGWAGLVQHIADDCESIRQELVIPASVNPSDYPVVPERAAVPAPAPAGLRAVP